MNLDKKSRENWKLAGITIVTAIITGWALDSIVILGILLGSGLLFGFLQMMRRAYERNPNAQRCPRRLCLTNYQSEGDLWL